MTIDETVEILTNGDEATLRELQVERPKTEDDLKRIIDAVTNRSHDYGTCCYAMSIAAEATFNYVASKLGVSGFQASCADLDILKRTRHINGPFAIITGEKMLYPQYNVQDEILKTIGEWQPWIAKECQAQLDKHKSDEHVHPDVRAYWERLAATAEVQP